jgi:2-polyprenyl-3-methyl-5-hydroxy-6-metoxy-1,4-benzoquinol methylase
MRPWRYVPVDCKKGRDLAHPHQFWCDACGYGRIHPIPPSEDVAGFYELDSYYTQGRSHFADGAPTGWLDRLRNHLAWRLDAGEPLDAERVDRALRDAGVHPARICDVGCGSGAMAAELAARGHDVTGVEVDESALASRQSGRFRFLRGTAEALPDALERGGFDAVVLSHVLEHCRSPEQALANVRELLAPGGIVLCEVPNNACLAAERLGPAWEQADAPRHLHFFTATSLRASFEAAGLSVERTWYAQFCRQFLNEWIATERMLWRNLRSGTETPRPLPPPNSRARAWALLARSLLAPDERRYDSVGLVARRAD